MKTYPNYIVSTFQTVFQKSPILVVRAPGRINLIGEHTDYNDGFVLPAAINKAIYVAIAPRTDSLCLCYAADLHQSHQFDLTQLSKNKIGWTNYIIGMVAEIKAAGYDIPNGFEVAFGGDVPNGAGLSSSAAVESGVGFALAQLYNLAIPKLELALIAQRSEHHFAGVKCGIMDMFASIHGHKNAVIQLDCRDLSYQYFPLKLDEYQIVLCNSGVKHSLAESAYNTRRNECEQGVLILQQFYPHIKSLRDISLAQVQAHQPDLPPNVYKRCAYVTAEIERVVSACKDLENGDLKAFGKKMFDTHAGLRDEYEVSIPELDFLVNEVQNMPDMVVGARLMGGGFGGCTINLVKTTQVKNFIERMKKIYKQTFEKDLTCYEVNITEGVGVIN